MARLQVVLTLLQLPTHYQLKGLIKLVLLTSFNRIVNLYGLSGGNDSDRTWARIYSLMNSVSNKIEQHCKRNFELTSYTQFFSPDLEQRAFNLKSFPVSSITDVYSDGTGLYTGDEVLVNSSDYILDEDSRRLILDTRLDYSNVRFNNTYTKSLRVRYTGGLAASATNVVFTLSGGTGSYSVGSEVWQYIEDEDKLPISCKGKVVDITGSNITVDVLYGKFEDARLFADGGNTWQNATVITSSLSQDFPDLVNACEMQVYYEFQNFESFGKSTVSRDGATKKTNEELRTKYGFLPEVASKLERFENRVLEGWFA